MKISFRKFEPEKLYNIVSLLEEEMLNKICFVQEEKKKFLKKRKHTL